MNQEDLRRARGVLPYDKAKDAVMANRTATGQYLFITLRPDIDEAAVRGFLAGVQEATDRLRTEIDGSRVATVAVGFSRSFFLAPGDQPRFPSVAQPPAGLVSPPLVSGSSAVPADVLCYIVSVSEAVAARFISDVAALPAVAQIELERGYQRSDETEHFGYRDGVRNVPDKRDRPAVVYIAHDELPEEPWWAHDGTYLAYLKIQQNREAFAGLQPSDQDAAIGRTRDGHRLDRQGGRGGPDARTEPEYTDAVPPLDSHVRKTGPRGAVHDTVNVFRRGLLYFEVVAGKVQVGLHFVSFQASLDAFDVIFNRWMTNPKFPVGGPNQPDRLLSQGLITLQRHGFYFVPPDTDLPIGDVMFAAPANTKKPKSGRVAVRKQLVDSSGQRQRGELGGFVFRLVDSNGAQIGGSFTTDGKGHALSDEVPVDSPLRLEETATPTGAAPQAASQDITLTGARVVVQVVNTVAPDNPY